MSKLWYIVNLLVLFLVGCTQKQEQNTLFVKVQSKNSNITFQNNLMATDSLNILDYLYFYNGAGVAVGDINNDDLIDVFFTSNQGKNSLYLNKGNFQFDDITKQAGVEGNSDWNTSTVMADVNGDGYLDIYVCAVSGIQGLKGKNELFINNRNGTFTEQGEQYQLDFENYSTTSAFFDYDNDGDLDMYLLNHAVHTQNSFGKASIRNKRDYKSGDKLLRNDGEVFTDVSLEAGIFGGANGYGLGVATSDFNNDGFVDIYVSNDFHEDDYYYINNGDGTFSEKLKEKFGHTSRFSMGNDVADINNDGYMDMLTLDMAPEDEKVLKASVGDETIDMLQMRTKQLGYHYQYARNMLHINQSGAFFSETALLSGISETDWSWSALFADYDQDGNQDIFISNGIPKRPNDLDYIKFISNEKIKDKLTTTKLIDQEALDIMPTGAVQNYIFKGEKGIRFTNQTLQWLPKDSIISTGSAYADLDNDGDLDVITNNLNAKATIFENKVDTTANYLKLKFVYKKPNPFGIGTKVISYHQGKMQYKQLYTSRGFQSSSEPIIHLGYKDAKMVDSLKIIWPDHTIQVAEKIKTNQTLTIKVLHKRNKVNYPLLFTKPKKWFRKVDSIPGLRYTHEENNYQDVNRQKLIPYKISDKGPGVAVGDINSDGRDDIFFGSAKHKTSKLFLQTNEGFVEEFTSLFTASKTQEDVVAVIEDFNNDNINDLLVGTAGGEFFGTSKQLLDRLYINKGETLMQNQLADVFEQTSVIEPCDIDNDGDLDLFVGGYAVSNDFGKLPNSYILKNDNGSFSVDNVEELETLGMITDAIWTDFNEDDIPDLITVGEWTSPQFFENKNGKLSNVTGTVLTEKLNGLWQTIQPFDIDNDGDVDYMLGNYGLNTKFRATEQFPLRMYYGDFDGNQKTETILAQEKDAKYYTLLGLDDLAGQMNFLRKKFTSYKSFAGKTIEEIFDKKTLDKARLFEVHQLASGYLKNEQGTFTFVPFDDELQVGPMTKMISYDFDKDGSKEVLMAGNYHGLIPFHGRFDGFPGAVVKNDKEMITGDDTGLNFTQKSVRSLNMINFKGIDYLLVTMNNEKIEIYAINE